MGAQLEQQEIRHDRHGHGAFHAVDPFGDLMLAQPDHALQFFKEQFDPPPSQIDADNLTRGDRLRQIGYEDSGLLRPLVTPTLLSTTVTSLRWRSRTRLA